MKIGGASAILRAFLQAVEFLTRFARIDAIGPWNRTR
jgi:hypothetical protein